MSCYDGMFKQERLDHRSSLQYAPCFVLVRSNPGAPTLYPWNIISYLNLCANHFWYSLLSSSMHRFEQLNELRSFGPREQWHFTAFRASRCQAPLKGCVFSHCSPVRTQQYVSRVLSGRSLCGLQGLCAKFGSAADSRAQSLRRVPSCNWPAELHVLSCTGQQYAEYTKK